MKSYFLNLFKYHEWANKKVIKGLRESEISDEHIINILSHLLLAEITWLLRLKSAKYDNNFWIELNLTECENLSIKNAKQINEYLNSLSENDFNNKVTYTNSKEIEYTNTITEILTHLSHHSSYHRGQIAREVRKLGKEPAYTDYIAFLR